MYPPHWSPCISWGHVYEIVGQDTHGHPVYRVELVLDEVGEPYERG